MLIKYFLVALLTLIIGLVSRHFLSFYMDFGISVILSYLLGLVISFALSAKYIFPRNISLKLAFVRFSFVACIGLLATFIISVNVLWLLQAFRDNLRLFIESNTLLAPNIDFLMHPKHLEFVAHVSGVGGSFICNFLGHKYFSFHSRKV